MWWPGIFVYGFGFVVVAAVINTVMFVVVFTVVDFSFWALDCYVISAEMVIIVVGVVGLGSSILFITVTLWEAIDVLNACEIDSLGGGEECRCEDCFHGEIISD